MPIYEYRCDDCGHELEKLQRMSDDLLRDCPACGAPSLRRLVSAAAFRLKGSGWYETDFKKDNQRNLAGDGKPPEGKKEEVSAGKAGDSSGAKADDQAGSQAGSKSTSGSKESASKTSSSGSKSGAAKAGGSTGRSRGGGSDSGTAASA